MPENTRHSATLTVHGLALARAGRTILEAVDLSLAPGDAIVLRGPNGAGKTTLLRTIGGFLTPKAGEISVSADNALIFCGVKSGAKDALSVEENLKFWARLYGGEIEEACTSLGLADYRHRLTRELSTGYQRRLGLARLNISARPIWLIDEPTSGLDRASVSAFETMLAAHREQGGAAIIATHDDVDAPNARVMEISQ